MSTYNGEKFIKQQIDSILAQEDVEIKLIIRDDGSSDETVNIIKEYGDKIILLLGKNIGCEESFRQLLYMNTEADYFAFADQDDVWHPRKIISAIDNIMQNKCDLSVCNLMLVDSELNQLGPLFSDKSIEEYQAQMNSFAQTNLHGCVQVWTKNLHKLIQAHPMLKIEPHDVWVNAVANVVSSTFVDKRCFINYRLHGNNVSGYTTNVLYKINKRIKLYFGKEHPRRDVLWQQILKSYGCFLNKADSRYLAIKSIAEYQQGLCHKFKLLFSPYFNTLKFPYSIIWRICVLFNKY